MDDSAQCVFVCRRECPATAAPNHSRRYLSPLPLRSHRPLLSEEEPEHHNPWTLALLLLRHPPPPRRLRGRPTLGLSKSRVRGQTHPTSDLQQRSICFHSYLVLKLKPVSKQVSCLVAAAATCSL